MVMTKRRPVTVGEMLTSEFLDPLSLTQIQLAERGRLARKHVNELCRDRRAITVDTALILARVFGNSADFWIEYAKADRPVGEALNTPSRRLRITTR